MNVPELPKVCSITVQMSAVVSVFNQVLLATMADEQNDSALRLVITCT